MQRHDGFVVIAVLVVLPLIASMVGSVSLVARGVVDGAYTSSEQLQMEALAQAGVELAAFQLYGLKKPALRLSGQVVRLSGGSIKLKVEDESGKIDLNDADPSLLRGLYLASGLRSIDPSAFVAAVMGKRQRLNSKTGVEDGDTVGKPRQLQERDGFQAIEELLWLPGIDPADVLTLSRFVTVYNPGGVISLLAAPDIVLSLLPGTTPNVVTMIKLARAAEPEKVKSLTLDIPRSLQKFASMESGHTFRVHVEVTTENGSKRYTNTVILQSENNQKPYYIAEWKSLAAAGDGK